MGTHDLRHDGQAEAHATVYPVAGVIEADEALEDVVATIRRHPRTVVVDGQDGDLVVHRGQGDTDALARVARRVLDEVAHDLLQQAGVAGELYRVDRARVDGDRALRGERAHPGVHDVVEVHRRQAEP